jgi:hypothetical protein
MALFDNTNNYLNSTKEFLESNSLIAKFSFLLLVIFVFIILLRLGASFLTWVFSYSEDPVLFRGMKDGKTMSRISTNPNSPNSIPILRSRNRTDGLEFTWSVWIFIDDPIYKQDQYKHVFSRGPNNSPGLYLTPITDNQQNLLIRMNTFEQMNEDVLVEDIPINKWVNIIVRCDQHQLDVYINGVLTKRHILQGVPKQNYDDVWVTLNGGFDGYVSELRYFARAIGLGRIQSIVDSGPNLRMEGSDITKALPQYLSTRWYFSGAHDGYNP